MLSWTEIDNRAAAFAARWRDGQSGERQRAQTFERDFVDVFGVSHLEGLHEHPVRMPDGSPNYVDYLLPGKIMIEMKSPGKSLATAYSQAMGYVRALKPEEIPVLVMVCDFDQIQVYNLIKDHPYKPFRVRQLRNHTRIFSLLAGYGVQEEEPTEIEVNTTASYKMARIHDELRANGYSGHMLEVFLVRLLFCMFAEDTGIFEKGSFQKYIEDTRDDGSDLSGRLNELFWVLNTPEADRMRTVPEEVKRFRYINGSIFRDPLPPAAFDRKMREALIHVSREFDWTQISPSIFGAMFQGVMDPDARRALGAHYTSRENILKVIRPLFLDALYDEFEKSKATTKELHAFQDHLASLRFLDPACGSGNFLIVAYQELRRLEFEVLKLLFEGAQVHVVDMLIMVKPGQFFGIEIEDFPCQVAQLSMLLMKHLMDREVGDYFGMNIIDFPIRENVNIVRGNALRLDWNEVCPAERLNYIIGNPPFVGANIMTQEQKDEVHIVFGDNDSVGNLDYVSCWYWKSAEMMKKNWNTHTCLVSTNSITQGEQVAILWKPLLQIGVKIDFAWRTFKWSNEAKGKAAVHCVIIGFSLGGHSLKKLIFDDVQIFTADNINPYLVDAPDVIIESRSKPLCAVSNMLKGSQPTDDGHFVLSLEERNELLSQFPDAAQLIRPFIGAKEYIQGLSDRYCFWLQDVSPAKYAHIPLIRERIAKVREFRLNSRKAKTRQDADTPMLFQEIRQPESEYILVPRHSSENRRYIPLGFMPKEYICGDSNLLIPNASLFDFGILVSNIHMAWMRTVSGRLKSDYRYSAQIVYNNFVWPQLDEKQRARITETAMKILEIRQKYPDASLAVLYDNDMMPPDLHHAHQDNDRAVWEAYGKAWPIGNEAACVAHLMRLYQQKTQN